MIAPLSAPGIVQAAVHFLNRADDPQLIQIYDAYEVAFPIDEEREELDGLKACLACNLNSELQSRFDGFEESWFYISDAGKIAGAINIFLCDFAGTPAAELAAGAMHINYIFVDDAYRFKGLATQLYRAAQLHAKTRWGDDAPFYEFCEQNTACIGRAFFERNGFKTLDFPYVQPALNNNVAPCALDLRVKSGTAISSVVLQTYLFAFLTVSVRKGLPINSDINWQTMKSFLEQNELIGLKDV